MDATFEQQVNAIVDTDKPDCNNWREGRYYVIDAERGYLVCKDDLGFCQPFFTKAAATLERDKLNAKLETKHRRTA